MSAYDPIVIPSFSSLALTPLPAGQTDESDIVSIAAQQEAEASLRAARASLGESQKVLTLTESLYHAGRTDLDNVQHAQMDRDKAETKSLVSKRASAEWAVARVLQPARLLMWCLGSCIFKLRLGGGVS